MRWVRGRSSDATQRLQGVPEPQSQDRHWDYFEWNPKWDEDLRFTVRSLSTGLLVSAGTPYSINGAGLVSTASDGTTAMADRRLHQGDSYEVKTYVPNPTARQMRGAPGGLPSYLVEYTAIQLPGRSQGVIVPLWGDTGFGDPEAPGRELAASRLRGHVPDRLAGDRGAPTMYDAVQRVQRYLNRNFTYSEKPGRRALPAQRVPVPRQVRLLPAVLRVRWR